MGVEALSPLDAVIERVSRDADRLVVVVGSTASGKSAIAEAIAQSIGGEIIGADSVQIYKYFDCGSGKATVAERAAIPHHLIDSIDPLEPFDAARYVTLADLAIADIRARGKRPVVCGGTFLWVKALTQGLASAPAGDPARREAQASFVQMHGSAALHARLLAVDPESAARLHPNDVLRVGRALEVFETSGRTMTAWQAEHRFEKERYPAMLVAPAVESEALDRRIEARVTGFLASGWVDEVRSLLERGYGEARAMGSVGYHEVKEHVEGRLPASALPLKIVRATRVYARRQRTWLRDVKLTKVRAPEA